MIELLTVQEAAALLKTSRQQVRKLIQNGKIPAVKVGRECRILYEALVQFLTDFPQ